MRARKLLLILPLFLLGSAPLAAAEKMSAKVVSGVAPPKEVAPELAKLLSDRSVQVLDPAGKLVAEIWTPRALEVKATESDLEKGVVYRAVPQTAFMGVVRLAQPSSDYRRQKVPAGVYTMRLSVQPMDGDHMGTAPYNEFFLLSRAGDDTKPGTMKPAELHGLSALTTNGHAAVYLLFPAREAGEEPKVVDKGDGHQVLFYQQPVSVKDRTGLLKIGLAIIGASSSA